ncbi:MAG: hypothetical protein EP343_27245 [Deltaproteobacteria bacterium]|nr:MAG: hypothetical protein EP343_27245 [Deltaproteobacteria bacterium]
MRWVFVCWVGLLLLSVSTESWAQSTKSDIGLSCNKDSDCIDGLLCVEVDPSQQLSVCLLACPQGKCLTGETCTALPSGKKVCTCDKSKPCKTGFPCVNGFCPGSTYCHPTQYPCLSSKLLCFQPIAGNPWGLCVAPCQSNADCPPPGTRCLPYQSGKACYCKVDSDCGGGNVCVDAHCHIPCSNDAQCKSTEFCTGKICEPRPPDYKPEPLQEFSPEGPRDSTNSEASTGQEMVNDVVSGEPTQEASTESTKEPALEPVGEDSSAERTGGNDGGVSQEQTLERAAESGLEATLQDSTSQPFEGWQDVPSSVEKPWGPETPEVVGQACQCSGGEGTWGLGSLVWLGFFLMMWTLRVRSRQSTEEAT